jgi:hypothetical protein
MEAMANRMTYASTPALFGKPASSGLGRFELDPEREATDFMTGFNIAVEKSALSLQERIEQHLGIVGKADEVVATDFELQEPWVPGSVTASSATTPSAPEQPQQAAITTTPGAGGDFVSGAIQGGVIGLIGSVVFAPKKVVAVASIGALIGGLIGAATSGRARP